ncbi:MAG TPA: RNA polymerase sigma factor [Pyrinomonadaceae bacterium]|nr:RNA polymerase sigma factor [Pyrinomonadaceae bacterium]
MASFDDFLDWLGPDGGQQYETIRAGLIRIFISKGFSDAEDLADETIIRVIKKLPSIREGYQGEKARYFHGVARNVMHEARRRKEFATDNIPERLTQPVQTSDTYDCLLKCLQTLPPDRRELILDYYLYEGKDKIAHHRRMAEELGITTGALRTRAHHTRRDLEKCVEQCARNLLEKQKAAQSALLKRRHPVGNINKERQP